MSDETSRLGPEPDDKAHAQARVPGRDGVRSAVGSSSGFDHAVGAEGKRGRTPFAVQTMRRIHFMQQWFTLSDPAMKSR